MNTSHWTTDSNFACYGTTSIDPPWMERGGGKIKRGADRHYQLVPTKQLPRLIMESGAWRPALNSHLWMWATKNFLPDALWLIEQLGFEYKTSVVWVKMRDGALQIGLGQYTRGAHELLLLGTRGDAMVPKPEDRLPDVIFAPRTKHSVKPQEAYGLIERVSPAQRLEMFARQPRPGWDVWGNEVRHAA